MDLWLVYLRSVTCYTDKKTKRFNPFTATVLDGVLYGDSNFWVCRRNPMLWPFKWKLSACTYTWCYLFFQNFRKRNVEIWSHLAVERLKNFMTSVNLEDLHVDFVLQHFNLCFCFERRGWRNWIVSLILTKKRILVIVWNVFPSTQLRRRKSIGRDARDILPKRKESDSFYQYDNKHNNNNNNNNNKW